MTSLRMSALYGRSLVRMPARRTMPSTLDMRYKARWDRVPEFWVWRSDKMFRYALPYFARRGACRTSHRNPNHELRNLTSPFPPNFYA